MPTFVPGSGLAHRPATEDDKSYSVDVATGYVNVDQASAVQTIQDAVVRTITAAYSDPYYDLTLSGDTEGVALSALDATGTLANGRLSRVSNGDCRVLAKNPLLSKTLTLDMSRINENEYAVLDNYVSGSLARHVVDQLTTLIAGKGTANKPVFSQQDHTNGIYTRNLSCWAATLDLTAVSPWNSLGGATRAGTAITPRHIIQAHHYPLAVGNTIRFVTNANAVVTREVDAIQSITTGGADIQIALLDQALPSTISPVSFAPATLYDYLPSLVDWPVPLLAFDFSENALIVETNPERYTTAGSNPTAAFTRNATGDFVPFTEPIIGGDSGNPIFLVIDGEPVLFSHWTSPTAGPAYHMLLTEIASALTSLGGGYSLTTASLSAFTDYGA